MKFFIINLLVLVFGLNQSFAFSPSAEEQEISSTLNSLESSLDEITPTQLSSQKTLSKRKFERLKRKNIKKIDKKISYLSTLSNEEQLSYALNETKNHFTKLRKVSKKILKRDRLLRKLAQKQGLNVQELKEMIQDKITKDSKENFIHDLKLNIESFGNYLKYTENMKASVVDFTYEDYQLIISDNMTSTKDTKKIGRKIASLDTLFTILTISIIGFFAAIAFLLIGAIVVATGGAASGLFILAGISGVIAIPIIVAKLALL